MDIQPWDEDRDIDMVVLHRWDEDLAKDMVIWGLDEDMDMQLWDEDRDMDMVVLHLWDEDLDENMVMDVWEKDKIVSYPAFSSTYTNKTHNLGAPVLAYVVVLVQGPVVLSLGRVTTVSREYLHLGSKAYCMYIHSSTLSF